MPYSKTDLEEWVKTLTTEEIEYGNRIQQEEAEKEYALFKSNFEQEKCYICNSPLKTMKSNQPCLHWLLRQCKFKKKDFKLIYERFDYFNINAYLRWVANQEKFIRNINNLKEEKDKSKLIEHTIRYKHIDWSISCSFEDFKGHKGKQVDFPHYHFQMRINGQQFINFNDYHIPFTDQDIFKLTMINEVGAIESYGTGGVGLEEGFEIDPEDIIEHSSVSQNEEDGIYHISSMAQFKGGTSGEEIHRLFKESERTGKTMASLLRKYGADVTSIITPVETLPDIAKRSGRGKS